MYITKKAIPRRTILRGLGTALALPLLDSMIPALTALEKTPAKPLRRLGFVYIPNGAVMGAWTPATEGAFELSPTLSSLRPFYDQTIVPSGLSHPMAEALGDGNGVHARASAAYLSATHPRWTEGADVRSGTTVDQVAAQHFGKETQLSSLELTLENSFLMGNCDSGYSCVYSNSLSWKSPTTPLPMEYNPKRVFERLFGEGGTAAERQNILKTDGSLLDAVRSSLGRLQSTLSSPDRARIDQYLDNLRDVERRIQRTATPSQSVDTSEVESVVGVPESVHEHIELMFDLLALAFQADITRVFTFQMGREITNQTYPMSGVDDPHHPLSHHQNDPVKLAKLAQINKYHVTHFARFLEKLQATSEGQGTMLDQSLLMYGGGLSDSNMHTHFDLPVVLVGGKGCDIRGGRHIKYPTWTPMSNFFVSLLNKCGVPTDTFGDSKGEIAPNPLSL